MGFDIGINFRGTSGFVADGANETYCLADAYPTTRGGFTFGWLSSVSAANRSAAVDHRLAGINFNGAGPDTFQLDLPSAGSTSIYLGLGDASASHTNVSAVFKDNASTMFTVGPVFVDGITAVWDATGTSYTMANWPASESPMAVVMTTTTLKITFTADANWTVAHIRVVGAGSAGYLLVKN